MKRQKRDRMQRAQTKGFTAGMQGRSREDCPYQEASVRGRWMSGWLEAREKVGDGFSC